MLNLNDINPSLLSDLKRECEAATAEGLRIRHGGEVITILRWDGLYYARRRYNLYLLRLGGWDHTGRLDGRGQLRDQAGFPSLLDALCALKRWAEGDAEAR